MIRFESVSKSFDDGASFAVHDCNLEIARGELLVLLGESGCGKTTTLRMINRLIEPTTGRVFVDGRDTSEVSPVLLRREIGYVIQGIGLFPHLSVAQNVGMVPTLLNWDTARATRRVRECLELVKLPASEFGDRNPQELSGGQQQRVGVARALAAESKILLMDEPFGALDPITRDTLQEDFRRIVDELKLTVVMVTHDMMEALLLADRIAVMKGGGIVRIGTPHELLTETGDGYVRKLMHTPNHQAVRLEELARRGESS